VSDADLASYLDQVRWTLQGIQPGRAAASPGPGAEPEPAGSPAVLVGEPGVGKSSLINALLGADLLPTGADGASGAYCVIRRGPAPAAVVHLPGGGSHTAEGDAAAADVLRYGRADADPIPTWIEVELPEARLDGLQIVDTPGVGGLAAHLNELTLRSLQLAEALVFVSSCSAPLSRSELDFLRSASARVERVIFVLTKVEGPGGWRKVAEENRVLLAEESSRFAGSVIVPVSAKLARDALRLGRPDLSERLLADSGIPALWQELRAVADRRTAIREANRLRAAHSALRHAYDERRHAKAVAESAIIARTEMEQGQARLAELGQRSESWYFDLSFLSRKLQRSTSRYLRKRSEALRTRFDRDVSAKGSSREAAVRKLIAGVAELDQEVVELLRSRLEEIITAIGEDLSLESRLAGPLEDLIGDSLDVPLTPPSREKRRQPGEGVTVTQTSYMGTMMGHTAITILGPAAAALGPATGGASWAVAGAVGLGWMLMSKKIRGSAITQAGLREWASLALSNAVYEMSAACDERIDEVTHLIQAAMRTAFPQEIERLRREVADGERAIAAGEVERKAILDTINYQIDKIQVLSLEADRRIRQIAPAPAPAPE
jgi:Dynamin family